MIHLGDITKISGYEVPIVDCVIGGSPCQDLSIAGKRAGLAGERSGLYIEQIRLIKEMREQDVRRNNGRADRPVRPRYMVWENVPGAFSSNKGKDFAAVLEEAIRIAEPEAPDVPVPPKGWPTAGSIVGDGWSVAWRTHDAQYWGVPQRRKRISLVADFGGRTAPEILFECQSLPRNTEPSGEERERPSKGTERSASYAVRSYTLNTIDRPAVCLPFDTTQITSPQNGNHPHYGDSCHPLAAGAHPPSIVIAVDGYNGAVNEEVSSTLGVNCGMTTGRNGVIQSYTQGSFGKYIEGCGTLRANGGDNGGGSENLVTYQKVTGTLSPGAHAGSYNGQDAYNDMFVAKQTVRRLTPLECERLQGFPDNWTNIGEWTDSKGKKHECSDSARYKALGNSIALPFWRFLCKRISAQYARKATMASLFDGIGGFPLVWEEANGKGSAIWASEIEEFPMAVTKYHFGEMKN